jgi:hypothetical protein
MYRYGRITGSTYFQNYFHCSYLRTPHWMNISAGYKIYVISLGYTKWRNRCYVYGRGKRCVASTKGLDRLWGPDTPSLVGTAGHSPTYSVQVKDDKRYLLPAIHSHEVYGDSCILAYT